MCRRQPGLLTQALTGLQESFTEKCAKRANDMSAIVKLYVLRAQYRAAGMVSAEISQVQAREELKNGTRAPKWRTALNRNREMLENPKHNEDSHEGAFQNHGSDDDNKMTPVPEETGSDTEWVWVWVWGMGNGF